MPLETKILVCLSTAHVDGSTARELDALIEFPLPLAAIGNPDIWQGLIVAERWQEYGWFVWVKSSGRTAMPASLQSCLDYVETAGAEWVQFDRDCEPITDLPTFDW
ncbi:DUF5983 family protein [Sphingobium sp. Z007]|uniref:DUF5983 family protein n=1 Tax=Sphingobium sp. Z007 TaxID=627495 RepID=UPI000B49A07F|nr:hypothetical protein [Sphingobium sp. Z007]